MNQSNTTPQPAGSTVDALLAALKNSNSMERLQAAEELGRQASSLAGRLVEALSDRDWRIRWGAAHALGKSRTVESASALRPLLKDIQPRVARTAAWALGRLRDGNSVPELAEAVQASNAHLRAAAAWALGHIGSPEALEALSQALDAATPGLLRSLSLAFAEIGPEAATTLVRLLQEGSVSERTRAARILSRFGANAASLLLPLLSSPDVKQRRAAAHILGTLRFSRQATTDAGEASLREAVEDGLIRALEDEDSRVRRNAARSAGVLEFTGARPALEELLKGEPEQVRVAANALAALGDTSAGPALHAALEGEKSLPPPVEVAVHRALRSLGLEEFAMGRTPAPAIHAQIPSRHDYMAVVTGGLEAVAWEEIAARLPGALLKNFGEGTITFQWTGSPQAGAILRSVRRLYQGGGTLKEIPLAKRLRRYRVRTLPASLEPTTAYVLGRLANMGERDVFVDLTCGAATIAIERALDGPAEQILAGDTDPAALACAQENITAGSQPVSLIRWDARQLPLPDHSVTAIAANLPYGRRSGHHQDNIALYPAIVKEVVRVLKNSGTAVFLTTEKRLMRESLANHPSLHLLSEREIEAGGLRPSVFVLQQSHEELN